jgi:hypothetical protein
VCLFVVIQQFVVLFILSSVLYFEFCLHVHYNNCCSRVVQKFTVCRLPAVLVLQLLYAVVKPAVQNTYKRCRSRKCIRWHIPVHAIFAVFIYFFIPALSRPSFTSRTPNKDQKTEQLLYFLLVQLL